MAKNPDQVQEIGVKPRRMGSLGPPPERQHKIISIGPFIMVFCEGHRTFMQSHPGDRWTEQAEPFGLLCQGCAAGRPLKEDAPEVGDGALISL